MNVAWLVTGKTEAGMGFSYIFDFMPSDEAVEAFLHSKMPQESKTITWSLFQHDKITSDDLTTEMYESYAKFKNSF